MPGRQLNVHALLSAVTVLALTAVPGYAQGTESGQRGDLAVLLDAGLYARAETEAERSLKNAAPALVVDRTADYVVTLVFNGRGSEARTRDLAQSIVTAHRAGNVPSSRLATSLRVLGDVRRERADYDSAVAAYREAIALRESSAREEPLELAPDLERLARALTEDVVRRVSAFDEGLALVERALTIREGAQDDPGIARALAVRGQIWQGKGDYPRARADFERSLDLSERAHSSHPETAIALRNLGEQLRLDGSLVAAERMLSHACAMSEATLRAGHPDIGHCLRALAIAYRGTRRPFAVEGLARARPGHRGSRTRCRSSAGCDADERPRKRLPRARRICHCTEALRARARYLFATARFRQQRRDNGAVQPRSARPETR